MSSCTQRRVCDACSVRRVRCDGAKPCAGCSLAAIECTRVRPKRKSGPKGPRRKTLQKVADVQRGQRVERSWTADAELLRSTNSVTTLCDASSAHVSGGATTENVLCFQDTNSPVSLGAPSTSPLQDTSNDGSIYDPASRLGIAPVPDAEPCSSYPYRIPTILLEPYLNIYHHKLHLIWPIVNKEDLVARLQTDCPEPSAYVLALSVCVATVLQLQLENVMRSHDDMSEPRAMLQEIEALRQANDYQEISTADDLSTSFFLHIAYLHIGRRKRSTLLLREAITIAHMLGLHRSASYEGLQHAEEQARLRKVWLLFITERAHATQYDLPCVLVLDSDLPALEDSAQQPNLAAFTTLCRMFTLFNEASSGGTGTVPSLNLLYEQLTSIPMLSSYHNELSRADTSITQQWMRLMFWKFAIRQMEMTSQPDGSINSVYFPLRIARELMSTLSAFSIDTLEAHGPGMELKLFDFANAVVDVMACVPSSAQGSLQLGPQDFLLDLASILGSFRGGNNALLPMLQSRLAELNLDVGGIARCVELDEDCHEQEIHTVSPGLLSWRDTSLL